jgi:hypothetical protein
MEQCFSSSDNGVLTSSRSYFCQGVIPEPQNQNGFRTFPDAKVAVKSFIFYSLSAA